ncbi:TPA: hypothetical protein N0F65_013056 [Lagenidium giganteum]|uniref:FYVE-type domain-containing protein n=1 Tax=Lagenidium giganteum TaxID=4803 RepID=A0AAV2YP16_9STRA|nr:TPA: hypothetical protein N0F65_013056 [Lagenidium giganteum]
MSLGGDGLLVQLSNQKKLYLSNEILYQEAVSPVAVMRAVMAKGLDPPMWRRKLDKDDLELYETPGVLAGNIWQEMKEYAVAAKLELNCHLNEVFNIMVSDETNEFEGVMRGMFGKKFKKGSILHRFDDENAHTKVLVKSATFANSLTKDLEICFVDYRVRNPETKSVTRVIKSLPKEFHERLVKNSVLGGAKQIMACFHAEQVGPDKTRLFVYSSCAVDDETNGKQVGNMDKPMHFISAMVKSSSNIEEIIRRRRLGYQSYIYLSSKILPRGVKNCKVCDKTFGVLRIEHFCQLCGYRTCSSCSEVVDVEPKPGLLRSNRVCKKCEEIMKNCVFDDEDLDLLGSMPVSDIAASQTPGQTQATSNKLVLAKLRTNSQHEDESTKLVEFLFSADPAKQTFAMEHFGINNASGSLAVIEQIVRHHISQPVRYSVAECLFAEADGKREYLLNFEDGLRIPDAPPGLHEHVRRDSIARLQLTGESFNAEPFQVLCEIAAKVMECRMAYISVVTKDMQYAIAQYNMPLKKLPRKETLCAYALTSDQPFLVRNAFHDIRFREFFCVARTGIHFFASFPVDAPASVGGGIVAALVVADKDPKKVITNRQYSRMITLSKMVTDLMGTLPLSQ